MPSKYGFQTEEDRKKELERSLARFNLQEQKDSQRRKEMDARTGAEFERVDVIVRDILFDYATSIGIDNEISIVRQRSWQMRDISAAISHDEDGFYIHVWLCSDSEDWPSKSELGEALHKHTGLRVEMEGGASWKHHERAIFPQKRCRHWPAYAARTKENIRDVTVTTGKRCAV